MTYSDAVQFSIIYAYPLWLVGTLTLVLLLLAQEVGYRLGLRRLKQEVSGDAASGGGGMVLSSLLALVGLLMAFTYSAAVYKQEERQGVQSLLLCVWQRHLCKQEVSMNYNVICDMLCTAGCAIKTSVCVAEAHA